mmetsp:Transcript_11128/g.24552  ORF Transcript_11128/g.24552 Transcript_11128/m.24552 type:complete len:121 (-) Transcript_11128:328-690(-)
MRLQPNLSSLKMECTSKSPRWQAKQGSLRVSCSWASTLELWPACQVAEQGFLGTHVLALLDRAWLDGECTMRSEGYARAGTTSLETTMIMMLLAEQWEYRQPPAKRESKPKRNASLEGRV